MRRGDSAGEVADVEAPRLARGGGPRLSGIGDWLEPARGVHCLRAPERAFDWHHRALAGLVRSSVSNSVQQVEGGVKKCPEALDALGLQRERERAGEMVKVGCTAR